MEIAGKGSASEIYAKLKSKFQKLHADGKLQFISSCEFDDAGKAAAIKGTGFDALIQCLDDKVAVELKLGLLLRAMKGKIEDSLKKRLQDAIT